MWQTRLANAEPQLTIVRRKGAETGAHGQPHHQEPKNQQGAVDIPRDRQEARAVVWKQQRRRGYAQLLSEQHGASHQGIHARGRR